jgi:hypothetical protein
MNFQKGKQLEPGCLKLSPSVPWPGLPRGLALRFLITEIASCSLRKLHAAFVKPGLLLGVGTTVC